MGVLDKFEKGVERAFSTTFARAFRADLKPVDLASALRTEMDNRTASLSRGRTAVPNVFVVELSPADIKKVEEWGRAEVTGDLVRAATSHATDQGYVFVGPVVVEFEEVGGFKSGSFKVRSSSQHVATPGAEPARAAPPAPAPQPEEPAVVHTPQPHRPAPLHGQPILDVDGARYLLTGEVTVLGRGSEADIVISDSGVSRRHLEIRITPDGVIATDMGSTNGTYVEGHRVNAATLVDGNTLTIGRTRITFWAGAAAPDGAS